MQKARKIFCRQNTLLKRKRSARPAVNTLARKVYERLAADKAVGLPAATGTYIGEPQITWETDKADRRYARCTLSYRVMHRTFNLLLD